MVLDKLDNHRRYAPLHPAFARAFEFLTGANWRELIRASAEQANGHTHHSIDGERLYASIDVVEGRGRDDARLEAHRRYIDIQFTIDGHEEIGWKPTADCASTAVAFDAVKDITFFHDRPVSWLSVPAGQFAIFFPEDAHAPLGGRGVLKKAIVKIAVD
jgi:YhcH/YjgK/YiaL family protein